jgi:Phage integrase, N-terminal SAM-like domain
VSAGAESLKLVDDFINPNVPRSALQGYTISLEEKNQMARREYQDPPLKKSDGKRPFYYVRVYLKVLKGNGKLGKKYHRERLGWCHEIGKREAERLRADYLKKVNGQSYTVQAQIPLGEFAEIWREKHVNRPGMLGSGTRAKYQGHLARHILPVFRNWKLCDIGTEAIDDFLGQKTKEGLSWWTITDLRNILSSLFTKAAHQWARNESNARSEFSQTIRCAR